MAKVFLSVGSNMGDRVALLREAVVRLRSLPEVEFLDASPLYWTEPWERQPGQSRLNQDTWFFNCVIVIETTLEPPALLERVQDVERGLGALPDDPPASRGAGRRARGAPLRSSPTLVRFLDVGRDHRGG